MKITNSLWVEKYRPKNISDLVLPDDYRIKFEKYIKEQDIPSLLLHGPPGTGKSSIARILTSESGIIKQRKSNVLSLNGSSRETRGIDFVSNVIEPFLKLPVSNPDKLKIVFIDEADYLTDHAAHSLRAIIEKYSSSNRFIFTCNYVSKIPEALQSRLTEFKFQLLPVDIIKNFCLDILKNENIEYEIEDVEYIISFMYPDIRKIIDKLQKFSVDGKLIIEKQDIVTQENIIISKFSNIIENVINNQLSQNSKLIQDIIDVLNVFSYEIDYRKIFEDLFNKNTIPPYIKIKVNQYATNHKNCLSPSMNFLSLLFESIDATKNFVKMINSK